jgi:hypothetical protein
MGIDNYLDIIITTNKSPSAKNDLIFNSSDSDLRR